jgi:hypothetical protein
VQEFIQAAAKQLGIDASVAEKATGVVLGFIKSKAGADFGKLAEKVPGAAGLAEAGQSAAAGSGSGGGGLLGGVMNMASTAVGGEAGDALALTGKLKDTGLDISKLGSFGTMLVDFLKAKAGEGAVDAILAKLPALKKLMG